MTGRTGRFEWSLVAIIVRLSAAAIVYLFVLMK
jgi:hypothetical protein